MSEIKPAMTAEEWKHLEFAIGKQPGDMLFAYIRPENNRLHIGWNGEQLKPVENTAPLAALALYGQPFGFTQEDVRLLEEWRSGLMTANYGRGRGSPVERQLASLADRIKALLPPEAP